MMFGRHGRRDKGLGSRSNDRWYVMREDLVDSRCCTVTGEQGGRQRRRGCEWKEETGGREVRIR